MKFQPINGMHDDQYCRYRLVIAWTRDGCRSDARCVCVFTIQVAPTAIRYLSLEMLP